VLSESDDPALEQYTPEEMRAIVDRFDTLLQ